MKKLTAGVIFLVAALHLAAQSPSVYNIGAILDTPFLYQDRYPIESVFEGGYYQRIEYTYDNIEGFERPLPTLLTLFDAWDEQTGTIEVRYADGAISGLTFAGDDYQDVYTYTEYGEHGPTAGTIETMDGETGGITVSYNGDGLVERIEEENPYSPGLYWYVVDYRWTGTPDGIRPLAVRVELDDLQVEYYRYLYDARGQLIQMLGNAFYEDQPEEGIYQETYTYREDETRFFFLD